MDAHNVDGQGQIRDARHELELKAEELLVDMFTKSRLILRLTLAEYALKETPCDNLTLETLKWTVQAAASACDEEFEHGIGLSCPVCELAQCSHLYSLDGFFFNIAFSARHKIQHSGRLMSKEAWLEVFITEVIAKENSLWEEIKGIQEQVERLKEEDV